MRIYSCKFSSIDTTKFFEVNHSAHLSVPVYAAGCTKSWLQLNKDKILDTRKVPLLKNFESWMQRLVLDLV
jgi:hypothetical protein